MKAFVEAAWSDEHPADVELLVGDTFVLLTPAEARALAADLRVASWMADATVEARAHRDEGKR